MYPVVIKVVHFQGVNKVKYIERTLCASSEDDLFLKLDCAKKLYDIGEFKDSKQEKDKIIIVCSNSYYQIEISPDYEYGCCRYNDLKCILKSTRILCDIAICSCLFINCDRCKKHGCVHFDSPKYIDLNVLPGGWARVRYKTLCPDCSSKFDKMFSEFMENK